MANKQKTNHARNALRRKITLRIIKTNKQIRIERDQLRVDLNQLTRDNDRLQSQLIEAGHETKRQMYYWKSMAKTHIAMAEQFKAELLNFQRAQIKARGNERADEHLG